MITAPPEPFVQPELHGKPVLGIIVLCIGDPAAGAAALQPVKDLGLPPDHRLGRTGRRRADDRGRPSFAAAVRPFSTATVLTPPGV